MKTLYAIRQKLSLTVQESIALGSILSLLLIGFVIREFTNKPVSAVGQPKVALAENTKKPVVQTASILPTFSTSTVKDSLTTEEPFVAEVLPEPEAAELAEVLPEKQARKLALTDILKADDAPKKDTPVSIPRMNINTANMRQLEMLPGVGPSIAERIIAYRSQVKPFDSVEELMEIKGIGEKKFAKMQPYVFLGS